MSQLNIVRTVICFKPDFKFINACKILKEIHISTTAIRWLWANRGVAECVATTPYFSQFRHV